MLLFLKLYKFVIGILHFFFLQSCVQPSQPLMHHLGVCEYNPPHIFVHQVSRGHVYIAEIISN